MASTVTDGDHSAPRPPPQMSGKDREEEEEDKKKKTTTKKDTKRNDGKCLQCGAPSKMCCPTCKKLGLPDCFFCSKTCFKAAWPTHKVLHKKAKKKVTSSASSKPENLRAFRGYNFTGDLRPAEVTPYNAVREDIVKPDYWKTGIPVSEQEATGRRARVYDKETIEKMRRVGVLGREVLDAASAAIKVGVTTDDIDRVVHKACMERGCYPSPLNYREFPKSVCTSVNEVICHGIPDKRPLRDGDIVNLDVTVYKEGVHADLNETFFVGNVDEDSVRLVRTAFECLKAGLESVMPGALYRDIGAKISKVAARNKCSVVTSYCGHGIGQLFHTAPNIPHYRRNKAVGVMKAGHIFTIEPMINLGKHRDTLWPDNWTAVTIDGKRSAQFEHTILVTERGYELLTARKGEPTMIWDRKKFQR